MSPARTSIGTICTRVSDMDVIRPRGPGPGRVLTQRAREHPAQRGALTHGARARRALDLERNAAHEVDARDRHPHERAARPARPRHSTPTAVKLTGLPSDESRTVWNHRETRVGRGDQRSGRATVARRATATMRPAPPNKTKRGPDRPQDDAPRASAGQSANQ